MVEDIWKHGREVKKFELDDPLGVSPSGWLTVRRHAPRREWFKIIMNKSDFYYIILYYA